MNTTIDTFPALQRRDWKELASGFLIRHIMVVVMLLIVAFFAYRSARFATPDNLSLIHI